MRENDHRHRASRHSAGSATKRRTTSIESVSESRLSSSSGSSPDHHGQHPWIPRSQHSPSRRRATTLPPASTAPTLTAAHARASARGAIRAVVHSCADTVVKMRLGQPQRRASSDRCARSMRGGCIRAISPCRKNSNLSKRKRNLNLKLSNLSNPMPARVQAELQI